VEQLSDDENLSISDLDVSIGVVQRRLARAIDLDQIVILLTELLKDKVEKSLQSKDLHEITEIIESILSHTMENDQILQGINNKLKATVLDSSN
jgi:uncharacterized membrane protein YheB (UPF0754 family)